MRARVLLPALVLTLPSLSLHAQGPSDPAYGLSTDFRNWLTANGYDSYNFQRSDVAGGAYGGRTTPGQAVVNQPVIFIHGNSDSALGTVSPYTGWTSSITYFKSQGYTSAELYETTWGPADPAQATQQYYSKAYITLLRDYIHAVISDNSLWTRDSTAHS